MHKTDLPITPNKRHAPYFMDVISPTPMRRDFSAEPFLLLHIALNSSAHCTRELKSCVYFRSRNHFNNNIWRYQTAAYFSQYPFVMPNDTLAKPEIVVDSSASHEARKFYAEQVREGDRYLNQLLITSWI
jgi:hypothetical protein